jgi:predicted metal-binding membrane protein
MVASALLLRGSAEGVSSYRIFGDEAHPQQYYLYCVGSSYMASSMPHIVASIVLWILMVINVFSIVQ